MSCVSIPIRGTLTAVSSELWPSCTAIILRPRRMPVLPRQHLLSNFGAAFREHLRPRVIAHDGTDDDLRDIAQRQSRIPIAKEILDGVDNAKLHDPDDLSHIEVAREHERLLQE